MAGLFNQLKSEIRVDNYLARTSEGGGAASPIRQTGSSSKDGGKIVPASSKPTKRAAKE